MLAITQCELLLFSIITSMVKWKVVGVWNSTYGLLGKRAHPVHAVFRARAACTAVSFHAKPMPYGDAASGSGVLYLNCEMTADS